MLSCVTRSIMRARSANDDLATGHHGSAGGVADVERDRHERALALDELLPHPRGDRDLGIDGKLGVELELLLGEDAPGRDPAHRAAQRAQEQHRIHGGRRCRTGVTTPIGPASRAARSAVTVSRNGPIRSPTTSSS
jgi:hypothetical protein